MCAKFARQILSESVGKVLEQFGNMETLETAKYCKIFDFFFDCLNVRSLTEHVFPVKMMDALIGHRKNF